MSKVSASKSVFPPSNILVPIDGSENANRALVVGIELSKVFHAELTILNVIPTPNILVEVPVGVGVPPDGLSDYYEQQESNSNQFLERAMEIVKEKTLTNVKTEIIRAQESIVGEIVEYAARKKIDLIVIGTRGLGGFKKLLQGSVSSGVVTHAHCNTVVVR